MNVRIYSLYWDNIDPAIVNGQKAVFEHFHIPINQHRIDGINHGEWMDWIMTRMEDVDVFLFIDVDCIPLSKEKITEGIGKAAQGILYGAEGAANHILPFRSYAGAWYTYIARQRWNILGRPSARATPYADVAQNWTDVWKMHSLPVELIAPTACIEAKWDLPDRPKAYGIGTSYGTDCFHLFEARAGNEKYFIEKCRAITLIRP